MTLTKPTKLNNYKLLNITGLAIGITCVLTIMLWVEDELKYDSFHKNAHQIYRILVEEKGLEGYENSAMTMRPLSDALKDKVPEIKKIANFEMDFNVVVKTDNNYLNEEGMAVVGTDFFDIFSFPLLNGNPQLIKTDKNTVLLSEKTAKKYFGEGDAIGKQIEIRNIPVTVIAVFKDIDYNSHIRFDLAISEELGITMFGRTKGKGWGNQNLYTYILANQNTPVKLLSAKLYNYIAENIDPSGKQKLLLQPLTDIHFQKNLADEDFTYLGDKRYVYIFSFIGLFILLLACINFINLSTAVSGKDIKSNGIRKILGANKGSLIKTTVLKSFFSASIASVVALGILYLLLPFINDFTQKSLVFNFKNPAHILLFLSIVFTSGLLSGIYPAFYLSSFSPMRVLKADTKTNGQWQRNGLVVFQFSLSIILIIATIVSFKQLNHIRQINLGFDARHTIYFNLKSEENGYHTIKEKLLKIPGVEMVAGKDNFSPTVLNTSTVTWQGNGDKQMFSDNTIDEDFFVAMKVRFIDGQNFSKDENNDRNVIINRKAKEAIGADNPVGMDLNIGRDTYKIIGVIDDVHFRSLNEKVQPEFYTYTSVADNIFIRYTPGITSPDRLIDQIRATVKEVYPESPFDYNFLDLTYEHLYENDKRVGTIFGIVSIIAILISCLGLFALSSFSAEKRVKEIGIRKINGAKISEVLVMLNKDFVKWVGVSYVIALPVAWYAMHKWLQGFAYKTELSWWIFVLAGLLAIGISLLTVSWQSWKAATRNPVEALRYE